jgi:hypothetical protein
MLILPWLKLLPSPKLTNHITDSVEIGFGRFGPSLVLAGSLATRSKIIFVQNISIDLVHRRVPGTHRLNWFAFLPYEFKYKNITETDFLMPSKFMIAATQGHQYNILFVDQDKYSDIKPIINIIRQEWELSLRHKGSPAGERDRQALFPDFLKAQKTVELSQRLSKLSYWEEGEYFVNMEVITQGPLRLLQTRRSFFLSQKDTLCLRQNSNVIIADLCNQPGVLYQTLSLKLSSAKFRTQQIKDV